MTACVGDGDQELAGASSLLLLEPVMQPFIIKLQTVARSFGPFSPATRCANLCTFSHRLNDLLSVRSGGSSLLLRFPLQGLFGTNLAP